MRRAIVTYADGAHEELLDIALPGYREFADRHGYELCVTRTGYSACGMRTEDPPAWRKVHLILDALTRMNCDEVLWFDCDLVVIDPSEDLPPLPPDKNYSLVRHFEDYSEVPNTGVWRVTPDTVLLLKNMLDLEVFTNHGWWEQAALMTLMGYTVPPEGSDFSKVKCQNVVKTDWYDDCQFLRLQWNSHPNYRANNPRIVHCSYPDMKQRLAVMQELARNPNFDYPTYDRCRTCKREMVEENKEEGEE